MLSSKNTPNNYRDVFLLGFIAIIIRNYTSDKYSGMYLLHLKIPLKWGGLK